MAASLSEMPGLVAAKRIAAKLFSGSPVHAVLLYGSPGAGQEFVADAIAAAWLCASPGPEGACGICQACGSFGRGSNPDFQRIQPFGAGNMIRLGAIVKTKPPPDFPTVPVVDYLRTGPLMSRSKVVSIEAADRMNYDASNALLKILEEPQPYVRFVLSTSSIGRLLPTILSRCLAVACDLPTEAEVRATMGDRADLYLTAPHLALRFAESREGFDQMVAFVDRLGSVSPSAALRLADDFRALSGQIADDEDGERTSLAESLELLAILVSKRYSDRPLWGQLILESHRRLLGNVNARTLLDALFVSMLVMR